jgi:hypothetical protein
MGIHDPDLGSILSKIYQKNLPWTFMATMLFKLNFV